MDAGFREGAHDEKRRIAQNDGRKSARRKGIQNQTQPVARFRRHQALVILTIGTSKSNEANDGCNQQVDQKGDGKGEVLPLVLNWLFFRLQAGIGLE